MLNKVILMGRLTADPELKTTQSGISNIRFTIAVNRVYQKDKEQQADFINVVAWRQTAEFISKYFSKGKMIIVEGSLRNNNYTDANGVKHYAMDVLADNVNFAGGKQDNSGEQSTVSSQPKPTQLADTLDDLGDFAEILSDNEPPF